MSPRVSVILSVFNGERFLKETIESILCQTLRHFEFIIIDDSSTDNSWKLLQYYKKVDPRIVLTKNKRNEGETYSINFGIQKSRSSLIAITQCGAVSHESRLEKQHKWFSENMEYVLIGAQASYCDIEGSTLQYTSFPLDDRDIRRFLYIGRVIFEHPSVMFRKLDGMDYREEAVPEADFDFWLRVSFHGRLGNIDEVLVRRIIHDRRISLTRRYEQKKAHWFIHKLFNERLKYGEERSKWSRKDTMKKDLFEPFRNKMLYRLGRKAFQTKGSLRYFYVFMSFMFSPAPLKEIYYLMIKRGIVHFYPDRLLRKYLEVAKTAHMTKLS